MQQFLPYIRNIQRLGRHSASYGQRFDIPKCIRNFQLPKETFDYLTQTPLAGETIILDDSHYPLLRNGHMQECFVTYCATPHTREDGSIDGFLVTFMESTQKFLGERRTKILQSVSKQTITSVKMMEETIPKILSNYLEDIPFFMYYSVDKEMNFIRKFKSENLEYQSKCSAPRLRASEVQESLWPFEEMIEKRGAVTVEDIESKFGVLPGKQIFSFFRIFVTKDFFI